MLTIPKRLRLHTRFDRKLLGKLSSCAWACIQAELRRLLGREDVLPGMVAAIQTHGELLHWHPHIHALVTCGAFTPEGAFLEVPEFNMDRLQAAWREAVFALYLAEEKIEPEVVENMRSQPHSGFSVDQSAGDRAGIERLVQYMSRCPFSLSRLVKVSKTGQVIYKAEKDACRAFPEPQGDGLRPGPKRNFQVLAPLDFLAEFRAPSRSDGRHIPPKGAHLIRYYGWYSNKTRGLRRKAAKQAAASNSPLLPGEGQGVRAAFPPPLSIRTRCSQTWAMLIKRVYEIDPLACPHCGGAMKVVAFIEPPQGALIEKILRHCGLWHPSTPRALPPDGGLSPWSPSAAPDGDADRQTDSDDCRELTYVDIDTFEATFWTSPTSSRPAAAPRASRDLPGLAVRSTGRCFATRSPQTLTPCTPHLLMVQSVRCQGSQISYPLR